MNWQWLNDWKRRQLLEFESEWMLLKSKIQSTAALNFSMTFNMWWIEAIFSHTTRLNNYQAAYAGMRNSVSIFMIALKFIYTPLIILHYSIICSRHFQDNWHQGEYNFERFRLRRVHTAHTPCTASHSIESHSQRSLNVLSKAMFKHMVACSWI